MSNANSRSKNKWVLVEWNGKELVPHASYDRDMLSLLKLNTPIRAQFAQPRSIPRHRLYRVILRIVVENSERFATEEALHKTLLVGCGVVEPVMTVAGEIIMIPSSTAFDAMGEEDFKAYFDQAMDIVQIHIIPDIELGLLLKEARQQANWKEAA